MKILAISDIELGFIYNPQIAERFNDIDMVISCGDLPYYYLEFIISTLNVPLYFVRGNHSSQVEASSSGSDRTSPWGAIDLNKKVICDDTSVLLAGIEGSLRYNFGPHQYTQEQMWRKVLLLVPSLFYNKIRYGRYLDVFVTHAPPYKIHDMDDLPHRGIKAFRWLVQVFQPTLHLHGHIHIYRHSAVYSTQINQSTVINAYGYREIEVGLAQHRKDRLKLHPLGQGGTGIL